MPSTGERSVYEISDDYVERLAVLDPCTATYAGIAGHDHEMTDFSPAGTSARVQLARDTIAALDRAPIDNERDRVAAAVMRDRLQNDVDFFDAKEDLRPLRVIGSPVQEVRQCFDLMNFDTDADWEIARERMTRVPEGLAGIEATLREGVAQGVVASRRQALACAQQAEAWAGDSPFFKQLAEQGPANPGLATAADIATAAYGKFGAYLRDEYAPVADPRDPVGRERYALFAAAFNGIDLDLDETYAWGVDELHRIEDQMRRVADRIKPGASIAEAIEILDTDPARAVDGVDAFQAWNQGLIDRTISELNGTHFDIAKPLQRCEAMIAPPGGAIIASPRGSGVAI